MCAARWLLLNHWTQRTWPISPFSTGLSWESPSPRCYLFCQYYLSTKSANTRRVLQITSPDFWSKSPVADQLLEADPVLQSSVPWCRHTCSQELWWTFWKGRVLGFPRYVLHHHGYMDHRRHQLIHHNFLFLIKDFVQMRAGQIASILVSLSSDQTSTPTMTWFAFNSHPVLNVEHIHKVALATTTGSFDGGDQGLLNTHFSSWATQVITVSCLSGSG